MQSCESVEILMADALYGQLSEEDDRQLQAYLADCESCRRKFEELKVALDQLEAAGLNQGSQDYGHAEIALDNLWQQLQPELDHIDSNRARRSFARRFMPHAATALATAASVVLFLSVFDISLKVPVPQNAAVSSTREATPINPELMQYLGRVESMLLMLANTELQQQPAIPIGQSFARDLAFEANLLSTSADDSFISSGQSRLLRDIEFLLLQVANLDDNNMEAGVGLLQQFIEENSILFKIRLLEMRQQEPVI